MIRASVDAIGQALDVVRHDDAVASVSRAVDDEILRSASG